MVYGSTNDVHIIDNSSYVVLDFETTGLNHKEERVTQIGAIKFSFSPLFTDMIIKNEIYTTLVNPEREISEFITNLTGITNEMVKDAPLEKDIVKEFLDFLGDSIIIAHNAPFDLAFLHELAVRNGFEPKTYNFFCTRAMGAVLFPGISHSQVDFIELFDVKLEKAHDALEDATATKEMFLKLKHIAELYKINFRNKLIQHPDRDLNFMPANAKLIKTPKKKEEKQHESK